MAQDAGARLTAFGIGHVSRLREVMAGTVAAVGSVPANIANGTVAFAPVGGSGALAGATAALLATGVAGAVMGSLSGSTPMAASSAAALALTISGALTAATAAGVAPDPATAVAICAVLTILAAAIIGVVSVLRIGRLAAFVPYPVLAGFLNGTAVLLVLGQLGPMLGEPAGRWPTLAAARPLTAVVVLTGLAVMAMPLPAALERIPRLLFGLLAACGADAALRAAGFADRLGPLLGAPPGLREHFDLMRAGLAAVPELPVLRLWPTLAVGAATLSVLGILDTLGSASVLREHGQPRADLDQDLRALSAANFASGLAGGLPASGSVAAIGAIIAAGGRGRLSVLTRSAVAVSVLLFSVPVLAHVPKAAFAAVILHVARNLADPAILLSLRGASARHRLADAAVMGSVVVVAVAWSLVAAVGVGLALAALAFTASMARGVVRAAFRNPGGRSRTRRPAAEEALLLAAGAQIEVVELEGALFFGSADAVAAHVEHAAATGAAFVVLDLSRVTRIDLSGGRQLLRLVLRAPPGTAVLLAGLRPGCPAEDDLLRLALRPDLPAAACFPSAEAALQWAEDRILADAAAAPGALDPTAALSLLGLPTARAACLAARMTEERWAPGATVIRRGDTAASMFVLLEGSADVTVPRPGGGASRIMTLMPGAVFGEMAFLTGRPRSADVLARTALRCLRLDTAAMAQLEQEDPALAAALLRAVAQQLDSNLRMANTSILSLER